MKPCAPFFEKWNKQECNFDAGKTFNGECTQIIKQFCLYQGWAIPNGAGLNALGYKNFRSGFVWVENSITNVPFEGDIVVFNVGEIVKTPKGLMKTGHVAIARPSTVRNLYSFDQNWSIKHRCGFEVHPLYKNVLGWLHWNG